MSTVIEKPKLDPFWPGSPAYQKGQNIAAYEYVKQRMANVAEKTG